MTGDTAIFHVWDSCGGSIDLYSVNLFGVTLAALKIKTPPGNLVEVGFVRSKSDGIVAEIQIDNSNDWTPAGTFLKSPGSVSIPANPENLPRAVRIRARFLDGNDPKGNYSDTVNVVTTP